MNQATTILTCSVLLDVRLIVTVFKRIDIAHIRIIATHNLSPVFKKIF